MIPRITFPAHTQARMAAANAAKELKKCEAEEPQPSPTAAPPALPGHVDGLGIDTRQEILRCEAKVIIGYGTLEAFYPLAKNVNLAVLQHCKYHTCSTMRHHIFLASMNWHIIFVTPGQLANTLQIDIPHIVDGFKHTTAIGDIIILPDDMTLVTERGLKYAVANMKREIGWGSYVSSHFTKDEKAQSTYMVRPCHNPVDMIHGLNTLRAFSLNRDADFLAMPDGPIMTALERRAMEWTGNLWTLKRFLNTVDRELLTDKDRHLLARAWASYDKWVEAQPPLKTSGKNSYAKKASGKKI